MNQFKSKYMHVEVHIIYFEYIHFKKRNIFLMYRYGRMDTMLQWFFS